MKPGLIQRTSPDAMGNDQVRNFTESKLVSLSDKVLENKNNTQYRLATIAFVAKDGTIKQATAQIWEKNVEKVQPGNEYLTEVRKVIGNNGQPVVFLTLTALSTATMADVSDFDFSEVEADASTIGA